MKKFFKHVLQVIAVLIGVAGILVFLAFSANSAIVPEIQVTSSSGKTALAVKGNYEWNSFSESLTEKGKLPQDYVFGNANVLLVTPGESITLENTGNPINRYRFYQLEMKYIDDAGVETVVPNPDNSQNYGDMKSMQITAPMVEGTYIYQFRLKYYNNGEVSYGLRVIVSTEPNYDIDALMTYRNTSFVDVTSIQDILNLLPYVRYQHNLIFRMNANQQEIQITYPALAIEKSALLNNAIALFTLVPDLTRIVYETENETYVYPREEVENAVGRSVSDYAQDSELWKREILYKEKVEEATVRREQIYEQIVVDLLTKEFSGSRTVLMLDMEKMIDNEWLPLTQVDCQEILNVASMYAETVYEMPREVYDRYHFQDLWMGLDSLEPVLEESISGDVITSQESETDQEQEQELESGDNLAIKENEWIATILVVQGNRETKIRYHILLAEGEWQVQRWE